jgi:hypothetical protein
MRALYQRITNDAIPSTGVALSDAVERIEQTRALIRLARERTGSTPDGREPAVGRGTA